MKIAGSNLVEQPVDQVWQALLDPRVLVATIPGCERLESTGEHAYAMTVTAGVAAIKGTYTGSCTLSDLRQHESLTMRLQGAGAPGTVDATVQVRFSEPAPGQTEIAYDADAVVGGMVGGVGQRMLASVSRRMAADFFANVGAALSGVPAVAAGGPGSGPTTGPATTGPATTGPATTGPVPAAVAGVYTAPARPGALASHDDFVKGILVGAGLVAVGVVLGSAFGRRR